MQYISSDVIINDVKNRMQTYFASNKVDESILPRVIRKCVGVMGLRVYPEKRAVLEVSNYKALLPESFRYLALAMVCSGRNKYIKNSLTTRQDQVICPPSSCSTNEIPCEFTQSREVPAYGKYCAMTDDCGNILRLVETVGFDVFETTDFSMLRATADSKPYCINGCFNLGTRSQYEFEIKNTSQGKVIQTNFCDGRIYIEYLSDLEHEDHFEVPDNETVKDWIFEELRREIYTYLWDNGDDVMQRMQHSERELFIKQERARQVYSQRGVQERYDTANRLVRRYKAMESWMSPMYGTYQPRI